MNQAERAWRRAEAAMEAFEEEWFRKRGGKRSDGVELALAASDAVENLWQYEKRLPERDIAQAEEWLALLLHVPEIEKLWFGLREYRENHRVKPQLKEHDRLRKLYEEKMASR